jgi:hypothetical protein
MAASETRSLVTTRKGGGELREGETGHGGQDKPARISESRTVSDKRPIQLQQFRVAARANSLHGVAVPPTHHLPTHSTATASVRLIGAADWCELHCTVHSTRI